MNRTAERLAGSISITAATDEAALLARKLLEIHFKQHMKIKSAETRLARVQTDLFSAQVCSCACVSVFVFLCVYMCERERERKRVCACLHVCESVCVCV